MIEHKATIRHTYHGFNDLKDGVVGVLRAKPQFNIRPSHVRLQLFQDFVVVFYLHTERAVARGVQVLLQLRCRSLRVDEQPDKCAERR